MAEPTGLADELFPIITAADLDAALRFYEGLLGGRVEYRFPETGEPAYVSLRFGDGQLGIGRQEAGEQPAGPATLWPFRHPSSRAIAWVDAEQRSGAVRVGCAADATDCVSGGQVAVRIRARSLHGGWSRHVRTRDATGRRAGGTGDGDGPPLSAAGRRGAGVRVR
ncbi:VOC family protein [Micromonospora palythoicola]|uniref:VOC family protein n=1 Tax=Micromonospora palythoicola TaxID=3120507 RepID=UPI0038CBF5DA